MAHPDELRADALALSDDEPHADDERPSELRGWPRSGEEPLFDPPLILDGEDWPLPPEATEPCENCDRPHLIGAGGACPCQPTAAGGQR